MSDSKPRDPMSLYSTSSFGSLKPCAIKEVDVPWSQPHGVDELIPPPLQGLYGSLLESSVHAKGVGGLCVVWQSGLLLFPGAAALSVSMGRGGCSCASSVPIATSHHRLSGRRLRKRVTAAFCGAGGRPPPPTQLKPRRWQCHAPVSSLWVKMRLLAVFRLRRPPAPLGARAPPSFFKAGDIAPPRPSCVDAAPSDCALSWEGSLVLSTSLGPAQDATR